MKTSIFTAILGIATLLFLGCGEPKIHEGNAVVNNTADVEKINEYDIVDGYLLIKKTRLSDVEIKVKKVSGSVGIIQNDQLTEVSFPRLISVGKQLKLANNPKLQKAYFPELVVGASWVSQLELIGNSELENIELDSLEYCYSTYFTRNSKLTQEQLDKIAANCNRGKEKHKIEEEDQLMDNYKDYFYFKEAK